jgi:uncharacterized protein YaiE (UPF0345 family)
MDARVHPSGILCREVACRCLHVKVVRVVGGRVHTLRRCRMDDGGVDSVEHTPLNFTVANNFQLTMVSGGLATRLPGEPRWVGSQTAQCSER